MTKRKDKQKVKSIIERHDGVRLDSDGGYPSIYVIENGRVYWASVDHDGGPDLTVLPVKKFIEEYGKDDDAVWLTQS